MILFQDDSIDYKRYIYDARVILEFDDRFDVIRYACYYFDQIDRVRIDYDDGILVTINQD